MVFRRRRYGRKKRYSNIRRTRIARTRVGQYSRTTIPRLVSSKTHIFKRMCAPIVFTQNDKQSIQTYATSALTQSAFVANPYNPHTTDFGIGLNFQLKDVINSTEFTALFDRYKIVGVKLKFQYQMAMGGDQATWATGAPIQQPLPIVDYSFDADDAIAPANRQTIQTKGWAKQRLLTALQPFKVYYKPRVTKSVYGGGAAAYTTEKPCWLDCNNPDVEHYGFKAYISGFPFDLAQTGNNQLSSGTLSIQPTYYIACRDSQ